MRIFLLLLLSLCLLFSCLGNYAASLTEKGFTVETLSKAAKSMPDATLKLLQAAGLRDGDALKLLLSASELASSSSSSSTANDLAAIKSFGTVICNGSEVLGGGEATVYEYTASATAKSAALTHWQFTANGTFEPWTVRMYIDYEPVASLQFNFDMEGSCSSCAWGLVLDPNIPWGVSRMGKGAAWGGLYNNFAVPFQKHIRITAQASKFAVFYSILRGAENVPVTAGGLPMPPTARLRITSLENIVLNPLEFFYVLNTTGQAGVLAMWTMYIQSANANFLEACTRAVVDGATMWFIGDGEDFWDSAWYFNGGEYTFPQAGLTYGCGANWPNPCPAGGPGAIISAYRIFDSDPIVWQNSMQIYWRNGEVQPQPGLKCVAGDPPGPAIGTPAQSTVTSYMWYYTWPNA